MTSLDIYPSLYVCGSIHTRTHTCTRTCMHMHTHAHAHACMHTQSSWEWLPSLSRQRWSVTLLRASCACLPGPPMTRKLGMSSFLFPGTLSHLQHRTAGTRKIWTRATGLWPCAVAPGARLPLRAGGGAESAGEVRRASSQAEGQREQRREGPGVGAGRWSQALGPAQRLPSPAPSSVRSCLQSVVRGL